jgi:hypothetical protein
LEVREREREVRIAREGSERIRIIWVLVLRLVAGVQ